MLQVRRDGNVTVIALDRSPVNALDGSLVDALATAFAEVRTDEPVSGVVLTSTNPKTFSSGLDLKALSQLDRTGFEAFLRSFVALSREIFAFPKPVVAALTGHAIAGGCLLASAADRVLMADGPGLVGLSELRIGVPVPGPDLEILAHRLTARALEEVVLGAVNHQAARAVELGLVDRLVPSDCLEAEAVVLADSLGSHPGRVFELQKARLRGAALARMEAAEHDLAVFVDAWYSKAATEAREKLLASLRK